MRPFVSLFVRPIAEYGRIAARSEMSLALLDHRFADKMARQAAVAKDVIRIGGNDVRRVADDQIKLTTVDRFKKAAQAAFYVRDVIDSRIEEKVIERSRVGIGGDDAVAMSRGEQ